MIYNTLTGLLPWRHSTLGSAFLLELICLVSLLGAIKMHAWLYRDCYGLSRRQWLLWHPLLRCGPDCIASLIVSELLTRLNDQPGKRIWGAVIAHCWRMLQV